MDVKATGRYYRISPRKLRPLLDLIRGVPVSTARLRLLVSGKKGSQLLIKLLDSAVANATNNFNLDKERLYVAETYVSRGPQLKRIRFASRGRAMRVLKHTSHVNVVLRTSEEGKELSEALTEKKKSVTNKPATKGKASGTRGAKEKSGK